MDTQDIDTFDLLDIVENTERQRNEVPLHDDYSEESSP